MGEGIDSLSCLPEIKPVQTLSLVVTMLAGFAEGRFSRLEGYGAYAYRKSDTNQIIQYIANQKSHHKGIPFGEEYLGLPKGFDVEQDDRYTFKPNEYTIITPLRGQLQRPGFYTERYHIFPLAI